MTQGPITIRRSDPVLLPALLVGILPILAINLCLLISIQAETIPACNPYLEGCTSVSAAGRNPPAIFLFRGVMLPAAAALVLFWFINYRWLNLLHGEDRPSGGSSLWLGVIGAVFLGLYVTYLGTEGDFARLMRRYGVYVFFAFTALAQLLTGRALLRIAGRQPQTHVRYSGLIIVWLCFFMLVFGLANVLGKATLADPDPMENIIEWNFALLMQIFFLVIWRAWKRTGLSAGMLLRPPNRD